MSWEEPQSSAPFGTTELPYGVYSCRGQRRVGVAVGDHVVDLGAVCRASGRDPALFEQATLNPFLAAGPQAWTDNRRLLQQLLSDPAGRTLLEPHLVPLSEARTHLSFEVADYVDF